MRPSEPRWEIRLAFYLIIAVMILIIFGSILTGSFGSLYYVSAVAFVLASIMIGGLLYTSRPACPKCLRRGTRELVRSEVINEKPAYGLVTRTSHVEGPDFEDSRTITTNERVPVIKTTTRSHYQCRACQYTWAEERVTQREDFSIRETPAVVEKEVIRIPCKYCGALVDPVANSTCPRCGGKIL